MSERVGVDRTSDDGRMRVVALIDASCGYSRRHALALNRLQDKLALNGIPIDVIGVNGRNWPARLMASELRRSINFTLFQSPRESNYWSQLGGLKDDVFIYDTCDRLAYFIPFPHSYSPQRFVELAIKTAHSNSPCSLPSNDPLIQLHGVQTLNQQVQASRPLYQHNRRRPSVNERTCQCLPHYANNVLVEESCLCRGQRGSTVRDQTSS